MAKIADKWWGKHLGRKYRPFPNELACDESSFQFRLLERELAWIFIRGVAMFLPAFLFLNLERNKKRENAYTTSPLFENWVLLALRGTKNARRSDCVEAVQNAARGHGSRGC